MNIIISLLQGLSHESPSYKVSLMNLPLTRPLRLVQHCSKQELQDFLDNEDKLLGVINDLQQVM
jgi:hypothetical protein